MTGSVTDSEDLVQDALLRLHEAEKRGTEVQSRRAYAGAVVTRLAIDYLRSARVQREEYHGVWLPEPIVADRSTDPAAQAELADSVSMAFLVLLERLSPPQRAVLVLRDVLGWAYEDIADVIGKSPVNCRQLAVRARRRIETGRPTFEASLEERWALADNFFTALRDGDGERLAEYLADDVVLHADGGGKADASREPIMGAKDAVPFLAGLGDRIAEGVTLALTDVNGQPGATAIDPSGAILAVISVDISKGRVGAVRTMTNPDKLRHVVVHRADPQERPYEELRRDRRAAL